MKNMEQSAAAKIHDTIYYCIRYFNQDFLKRKLPVHTGDALVENFFAEVKEQVSGLPEILAPFFLIYQRMRTAATKFFAEQFQIKNDTIDSFLEKIIASPKLLRQKVLEAFSLDKEENYIEALYELDLSESLKLQVALLLGNFDYGVSLLVQHLREIYIRIDLLHEKYADLIGEELATWQKEENLCLFREVFLRELSGTEPPNHLSISLMNPYLTLGMMQGEYFATILGFCCREYLRYLKEESRIDLRAFLITIGNKTRLMILQELEKKELTITMLSKILDQPVTTLLRHVDILSGEKIIYPSKKIGLQIFYKINYARLTKAFRQLDSKIKENETYCDCI